MIELIYEIRRRVESELKPSIKFANPNLLNELIFYYRTCEDAILKALIKELMVYAGEQWQQRLQEEHFRTDQPKTTLKSYRGSVSIEETYPEAPPAPAAIAKPELIYRGQVVKK